MKSVKTIVLFFLASVFFMSCSEQVQTEKLLRYFLEKHEERIKPIQKQFNETVWATYSGSKRFDELIEEENRVDSLYLKSENASDYYQNLLNSLYDNPSEFEILEKIKRSGLIVDPLLKRRFEKVFTDYVSTRNNWDETEKHQVELFDKFYDLKRRENSFFDSLSEEAASERSALWISEFSLLTDDFRKMIIALNRDVQPLGYNNYFNYLMGKNEISLSAIDSIVESVERITRDDYRELLSVCQSGACKGECKASDKMTQYQFRCAHSRMIYPSEWKSIVYTKEGFIGLIDSFFRSGGFDIKDLYAKSDLWYNRDKINNSFFFCVDFDKADFRIYSNIEPIARSLNPMFHEFSHALHYQNVDGDVPYFLKEPHSIIAEAIGLYFDSKVYSSDIVQAQLGLPCLEQNVFFRDFTNPSRLLFLRKLLRNIVFERSLYENPDQDFNELWWNLNKQFLFIDPSPSERLPEWMTSFHFVGSQGINVDYLFAVAYAAQLEYYFPDDQFGPIKDKVMKYGNSLPWYELIPLSTGESLNLNYLRATYRRSIPHEMNTLPREKHLENTTL